MTYDEAILKLDALITELEDEEALTMAEYKTKAKEATKLLSFCQKQLTSLEKDTKV